MWRAFFAKHWVNTYGSLLKCNLKKKIIQSTVYFSLLPGFSSTLFTLNAFEIIFKINASVAISLIHLLVFVNGIYIKIIIIATQYTVYNFILALLQLRWFQTSQSRINCVYFNRFSFEEKIVIYLLTCCWHTP